MGLKQAIITAVDDYKEAGYSTKEIGETITAAHLDGQINKDLYMFAMNYLLTDNIYHTTHHEHTHHTTHNKYYGGKDNES